MTLLDRTKGVSHVVFNDVQMLPSMLFLQHDCLCIPAQSDSPLQEGFDVINVVRRSSFLILIRLMQVDGSSITRLPD